MADNVAITAGSGTSIATDEIQVSGTGTLGHVQFVKLVDGTLNGTGAIGGDATNGLDVDVTRLPALVAGSAVIGKVSIDQTTPGTTNLVALAANQSVNVAQINAVTPLMGNGATGTGAQRVSIANDSTGIVGLFPRTTGGLTKYHLVSANTTNATNVKASAGQLYGWYIYNNNAAMRKLAFHDTAGTPTAGASIYFTINVPPLGAANAFSEQGIVFATGIGITTVTDVTDAGATAVGTSDLTINLFYA